MDTHHRGTRNGGSPSFVRWDARASRMGSRGVARLRGRYAARFAALTLALWPALTSQTGADLADSRLRAEAPAPETGAASVRILGVNDLHGNLEPPLTEDGRESGGAPTSTPTWTSTSARGPE